MKIEYRTPAGTGSYSVLADEGDAGDATVPRISKFRVWPEHGAPQTDLLAFSASASVNDSGNTHWKMVFSIERMHASPDAAAAWLASYGAIFAAMVPRANIDIKVTVGATALTLAHAAVQQVQPKEDPDRSTVFDHAFAGQTYS